MSNRAWMPLHIDDYIRDTDHLSAAEHGAYLLLIMKYWRDGKLPADEELIRRYAKLSVDQWAESRSVLVALFDENWTHKRIDEELAKAADIIEKRRSAGRKTQFKGNSTASAKQMPEQVPSKSTVPLTSNLEDSSGDKSPSSPEPDKSAPVAVSPTIIELPCVSGKPFPITHTDAEEWETAFPAVDIRQQLSAMRAWLNANPTRRKTSRGMRRFVVSWLDRKQNESHSAPQRRTADPPRLTQGESLRNMAREKGVIDDTGNPVRHLETGNGNGENTGARDVVRLALASNYGW